MLAFVAFSTGLQPLLAVDDWTPRFVAAGYTAKADGSYAWDKAPINVLLITRPVSFAVTVGTKTRSSREHLDLTTPEMVRLAIETLRGTRASLAFEYLVQGSGIKPLELRDATVRWAETTSWSAIDDEPKPQQLKGFDGWFVVGTRTNRVGTYVLVGIVRQVP